MTSTPSLPAQIEAEAEKWARDFCRACPELPIGAENIVAELLVSFAKLVTLQQHERLEAVVKAARQWRLSLEDDGWDEKAIMDLARPGIYALFSALAALDSAAPEPPVNTKLAISCKDAAENSGGRR